MTGGMTHEGVIMLFGEKKKTENLKIVKSVKTDGSLLVQIAGETKFMELENV